MKDDNSVKKGRRLEDEVADIYRNMDGVSKVIQNYGIMGIQVDVYVEIESNDGIINRYAIDAKNFYNNVSAEKARKCINDFKCLQSNNRIDRGIIVAATGFTKDANTVVIEAGFIPLLIADLRRRALDFSTYLNSWIKIYEEEELPRMIKYISLTARKTGNISVGKIDKYIQNWLGKSGNHITLLGNYGTGKSTTLKHIMNIQAKRYLDNPNNERIPIFIELKGFRQAPKSRQLITDILVNDFNLNINFRKFQDMNKKGKFLILLDGFDEMADKVLDGLVDEHFEELSEFACENSKVVLSSRTHYFKDPEQLIEVHNIKNDLMSQVEGRSGYEILFLDNFSERDINEYLKTYFKDKWEDYRDIIKKTYDLYSLSEVPILLNMIVQTLPDMIEKNVEINRPAIYKIFTERWLKRDIWRRAVHKNDRLYFCKQLALYFYTNQQNSVHWRDLPEFIKKYFSDKVKSHTDLDIFDNDARTSSFLKRKEDSGEYSFVHKSFMEYFAALYFYENIENKTKNGLDKLKDFTRSKVIYEFLVDMLNKRVLDIIFKDIYKTEKYDYSKLMIGKEKSDSRIYTNPESLGNCAYLLAQKGYNLDNAILDSANLNGIEFKNISFRGASLSGASFKKCKLTNIDFKNSILTYTSFENAELHNIDFTGAIVDKADFRGCIIDNKTIITISKSEHWGTGKLSDELRRKIDREYRKPSELIEYSIEN